MGLRGDDPAWWKEAVVYQVYPQSFNDTDDDGYGDLPGITAKVDYLDDLGVDAVWLTPVYESPGVDNGYDIADYHSIDPRYGDMDDWEELLAALHERDIRLVMDLAVNHTSDRHEWFRRSAADEPEYREYYHWREGRPLDHPAVPPEHLDPAYTGAPEGLEEAPPNNWESFFGGPAWTYHEGRGEWYLHLFDAAQPDLNWENPVVRSAIHDIVEWWLERGIDGFRLDVINLISKPVGLPDGTDPDAFVRGAEQFVNGPRIHEYVGDLHREVISKYDVMTVGEMVELTPEEARAYTGEDGDGMSMVFVFDHMRLDFGPAGRWDHAEWTFPELRETLSAWQRELAEDGWFSNFLNNHDEPRMVSRFGNDGRYRERSAKLLATLTHTLRGTPYVYQGEEIGMTNYPFASLSDVKDVDTLKNVEARRRRGRFDDGTDVDERLLELVRRRSRDNARTPMQWTDGPNAGFTDGDLWIPVNPNHEEINVEAARRNPDSIWHYYRHLGELRRRHEVLVYGDYRLLESDHDRLWVYTRTMAREGGGSDGCVALVVLNFGNHPSTLRLDRDAVGVPTGAAGDLAIANLEAPASATVSQLDGSDVRPWEARVYCWEAD